MKNSLVVLTSLALILTAGCSSGGSNSGSYGSNTGSSSSSSGSLTKSNDFDRTYHVRATPNTESASDGGDCADSTTGTMIITNSIISGTAISSDGDTYDLTGFVDSSGLVTGGYAYDGDEVVSFSGKITDQSGVGVWDDLFECSGDWWLSPKP